MIDEDLDEALGRVAREEGTSKAAVIRRLVRAALDPLPPRSSDPLLRMIGSVGAEPGDIDDVVYGP